MGLAADIAPLRAAGWDALAMVAAPWREPTAVAAAFAETPYAIAFLSDGSADARWSYFAQAPEAVAVVGPHDTLDPFAAAAALLGPARPPHADAPPFQGGLAGLVSYEAGLRREPSVRAGHSDWPDLAAGLYPALLAFDHHRRRVVALGRGATEPQAQARARRALAWLEAPPPGSRPNRLAEGFAPLTAASAYRSAVAEATRRIEAGEIFQANIARAWGGRLAAGVRPFDLIAALTVQSPAPFAAYLRLPDRAVASNSPERFLSVDAGGRVQTRPIKGTRPRDADPVRDAALAAELAASPKDRAENLMIVDLMRNDLARVCVPGSVAAPELFRLESFANVHHLTSTVTGRLNPGATGLDLMAAAFPPGSITGAPKVQAMRVIAGLEGPRGPYCGSMFWAGFDGAFDSSVLIRTAALVADAGGWRFEARAGAGIVADSDPVLEDRETEAKIGALARAFGGAA
ncbi:MAG TPA: anthranilate synthase component I family protein [Caulobacteraceae bacterium]|nr:anthranilate synthase component I family protein [Caulobacteraceae bacterium]